MNELRSLPILEVISKQDLVTMAKEYKRYNEMTYNEQYNSKIYKLLSDINEFYQGEETIHQVIELIQIEIGRRALEQVIAKQS